MIGSVCDDVIRVVILNHDIKASLHIMLQDIWKIETFSSSDKVGGERSVCVCEK